MSAEDTIKELFRLVDVLDVMPFGFAYPRCEVELLREDERAAVNALNISPTDERCTEPAERRYRRALRRTLSVRDPTTLAGAVANLAECADGEVLAIGHLPASNRRRGSHLCPAHPEEHEAGGVPRGVVESRCDKVEFHKPNTGNKMI
eukprot:gene22736-27449_t